MDIGALSENLQQVQQQAAKALRQIMPMQRDMNLDADALDLTQRLGCDSQLTQHNGSELACRAQGIAIMESPASMSSVSTNAAISVAVASTSSIKPICMSPGASASPEATSELLVPTLQRLVEENTTLREAFQDANRRLSQLEEEKSRFFDEGVFELVNSVCGAPPGSADLDSSCENLVARLQGLTGDSSVRPSPSPTHAVAATPVFHLPPEAQASLAMPPLPAAPERSDALSGENAELRRELMRASELGEALEQQQRTAEDRMHKLEEERAWLAQHLARCMAAANTAAPRITRQALDGGTGASNGTPIEASSVVSETAIAAALGAEGGGSEDMPNFNMRRQLEEMNRVLRAEFQEQGLAVDASPEHKSTPAVSSSPAASSETPREARRKRHETEKAAIEKERIMLQEEKTKLSSDRARLTDEMTQQREDRDRIIANLNSKSQALEQRLRESEIRATTLNEKNVELQAALATNSSADNGHQPEVPPLEAEESQVAEIAHEGAAPVEFCIDDTLDSLALGDLPDLEQLDSPEGQQPDMLELDEAW